LEEQSDHFGARLLLGLLSGDIGEEDAARLHLEKAIALDADSFAAHYGLGRLLAREGKMVEALPHLKRALALNPTPETHYLVGRAYLDDGRLELALRHLQKAVRLDPHFDVAQYSLGFLYWQTNRIVEARKHLQAAYELKPQKASYRQAIETPNGDPLPGPPVLGWGSLFPGRKPKVEETRFHDLLWQDLQLHALPSDLAPFPHRRSAGRDLKKT
ncbi:MAG: tetratricopeptide repeat protein, partial [Blastocatellia bacterium]